MAALVIAAASAGCVNAKMEPGPGGDVCPDVDVPADIFAATCANQVCHDSEDPAGGLDLASPGVAERLIGQPSVGCEGKLLVDPEDLEGSFLIEKLEQTAPACGLRMPLGQTAMNEPDLACVRAWVAAQVPGAPGPDAGPAEDDAGSLATGCGGASSSTLFCDGFESELAAWPEQGVQGAVLSVASDAFRGIGALRVQTDAGSQYGEVIAPISPVTAGAVHLRAFVRVPAGPALNDVAFLNLGRNSAQPINVKVVNGAVGSYIGPIAAQELSTLEFPRDNWHCVELEVVVSDTEGVVEVRINGQVALRREGIDTLPGAPGIDHVGAGITFAAGGQPGLAVDIDEVRVASTPIGCAL